MSKKILFMSSAKLTAISIGLLLAVFCTIGMSFTPADEGDNVGNPNDSTYITGPRRSHWTTTGKCNATDYHNKTDYARTVAKSMNVAYGTVAITANSKKATPVTAADGSQSYVDWDTGIGSSETTGERTDLEVIHTNTITFTATPTDLEEYYFVGWYSDAEGTTQVAGKDKSTWEKDVKFPTQAGFTSYKSNSGVTTYEGSTRYTVTYYAKFAQIPAINVTFLAASTPARDNGYYTVAGKGVSETITTSNQTIGVKGITLTAHASEMAEFVRWYTEDGAGNRTTLSEDNPCVTSFTAATKVGVEWRELTNHHKITFLSTDVDANGDPVGSYTVDAQTVNTSNYVYNTGDAYKYSPTLTATPASGYVFTGWYTKHGKKKDLLSTSNPWNPTFTQDSTIYAGFAYNNYADDQKAQFKVGSTYYTDLNAANTAAKNGSNKTIVCTRDGVLPPGNYTISSGVTLYIPYNTSETPITKPAVLETATALSAYRTLTFTEGANINVNGNICVGGQIMAGTGSTHTGGYPHGACGMIDMSKGGHIELNDGANLYAWGFVKGQDMDQGNNTINVGTVTANSGSAVWEDFSYGDFRGGSACGTIKGKESSWKFFPFQSYSIHNVEIPVTFKYGSADKNYTCLKTSLGTEEPGPFIIIGSSNSLFKLKDSKSTVRKWYDPTTDLMCYELSGTSQLDALEVEIYVSVNSANYNLPIASNMHIILADCDMTLSKPMLIQPGAVIEIKNGASATLSSNMYLFDVDNWGMYVYGAYFKPFKNLTSHKNRGDGSSKDLLDDAKLIVDGTLNVTGKLYSTAGGANIMGNGGGKINFSTLPSATNIVMCTSTATNENVAVASANLCNDDASYTKSIASKTFHNVYGRWFVATDKDPKDDHTYKFTYITSGAVSGDEGTSDWTPAVYSWDKKAALDLTQKWHNVTADACSNWWVGTDTYFYNWTESSDWHQFIPMKSAGMYSGSNNKIYTKTDCTWEELGETDENCLYTNGGVKKALVDGDLIELEPNTKDPAYHLASDENRYFICFEGCNWHEATKYENAEKAYVVDGDIFIWYDGAWMNAEWKEPFFYTLDETNVPVYYEYLNGEWVLSDPYIRVIDGLENRTYWFLDEAFAFAAGSLRKTPTIKILRDISGITTAVSYTGANKTCTLDLNGHTITGSVSSMITVNAAGCTFNIEDNTTEKNGKINLVFSANNSRRCALYVQKGRVILNSGTISSTNTLAYSSTNKKPYAEGLLVASGQQFTMNGGRVEVSSAINPYGIEGASGTPTININDGTIETVAETKDSPYAVFGYGTINVTGGTINAIAKASSSAIGVYVYCSSSYQGTANISGGTILARSTSGARGAQCLGSVAVTGDYNAATPDNTPKARYYAKLNITGGTITAECTTSTTSYGVLSYGTTEISGGTITSTVQKSDQNTAYGACVLGGTTTIKSGANITANAPTVAYGTYCSGAMDGTRGWCHFGILKVEGGTITANTTNTTKAYGLGVSAIAKNLARTDSYKVFNGDYAAHGEAIITGGTFIANAKTTTAMGIFVDGTKTLNAASATPVCTINGGYYKATGTGGLSGCNNVALPANFQINGGYYSHEGNLATYAVSPKQVVTLLQTDPNRPDYEYKVAEAYTVTFKNGETQLQSGYQEVGKSPVYEGDAPTKASTTTASYVFDGWSTTDGGALVSPLPALTSAGATYYAHFAETTLKYMATFDAKTNGGNEDAQVIYVEPSAGVGSLPTATKTGYTFNGWYTAASDGTKITSATVPTGDVTYFAQFTVNSHTLTWDLAGGTVSTAGKIGSTTWPAKNATGTPSTSVAFGTILATIPVVTKTGYTFNRWNPVPTSSMPDEDVTYAALWNPNTNTKYTVKHYLQNVDGTYPADPVETQSLTGTTATSVTPEVKSYEGFTSPAAQTVTIAADGKMVVEYQYARRRYTFTLDAYTNGGTSEVPSIEVLHGATIGAVPPDAQKGCNDFTGWYTKPVGGVKITPEFVIEYDMKTLYAQFSDDLRTYPIIYNAGANGTGTVDAGTKTCGENATLSSSTFTRTGYTQTGWSLTDGGAQAYALGGTYTENAALTLYPVWTINKYTITWKNGSTIIETDENVNYGTTPSFDGTNPTKPIDASYSYTFDGWSTTDGGAKVDPLPAVSGNTIYYAHYSTTPTVASVTVGGSTTYYTDFATAWAFVQEQTANTTIKLLQDATVTTSMVFTPVAAMTCTFDLNNHTLSGAVNKLVDVNLAGSTFIITDNSEDKNGKISTELSTNARLYSVFLTAGTLKLQNGTISSTNPHTYSTASANKNSAASAVYVTAGQTFTMDNGTVESASQYASYAIYMARGTSTVTINNGLVKGRTTKSTTAAGIYNLGKGLTVNGGRIIGHAYTTTAYGIYLYGGSGTIKGGTIEATNDTTSSNGTTTTYGIYVTYYSSTYKGVLTIPSSSTVEVFAKARTKTSAAIVVGASSTGSTIAGGTFTAKTKTNTTAYGVYSSGNITISGGTFNVNPYSSTAYGIYSTRGKVTVNGNPIFNVTAGSTTACGAFAYGTIGKKGTGKYSGEIDINGGTFNVTSTQETAYGAYAGLASRDLRSCSATNDTVPGLHYMPGVLVVNDGTFNVKAKTTGAYGIVVSAAKSETIGDVTTARRPTATITGGNFKVESEGDDNATAYAMNTSATATYLKVQGGKYSTKRTNASETSNIEDKYTAPTKDCNYHVLPLTGEDPYMYEVAEAFMITFKNGDDVLQSTAVKEGEMPAYDGTPTKDEDESYTYTFSGWSPAITAVSAVATYTAQFTGTPRTYTVTLNTNGGTINADNVTEYTYGTGAILPTNVTKDGHEFGGWFDNDGLTGDAVTTISTTATGNKEYWAKWTASIVDRELDIVDWTNSTLTINANGLKTEGGTTDWKIYVVGKEGKNDYVKGDRDASRTLTIDNLALTSGNTISIQMKRGDGTVESQHHYKIPYINTATGAGAEDIVYVNSGKLTINASTTLAALYVGPEASVEITNGKLTVDKLVLRTLPWQAASISGNFTATNVYYTRIAPNLSTQDGLSGTYTYKSANYYPFALPISCDINDVFLSEGTNMASTYGSAWQLKQYNEMSRAQNGANGENWNVVNKSDDSENPEIVGGKGYLLYSNTNYYREFYFPVDIDDKTTSVAVSYTTENVQGASQQGWNMICSPLLGNHDANPQPENPILCWLDENNDYQQMMPDEIKPALPFFYQASSGSSLCFEGCSDNNPSLAPRRVAASEEQTRIQWVHLDIKDANGIGDQTSIYAHPTRYEERYQTGIDVAKQSLTASRARLYSSHAYGEMAFAGVADAQLEQGVPLTVYSPSAQELTFSLRDNDWLNRMESVWLIDKEEGMRIDLLNGYYTFNASEGTTRGRFFIQGQFKAPQVATDIQNGQSGEVQSTKARKVMINQKIFIEINGRLYDATGKEVKR